MNANGFIVLLLSLSVHRPRDSLWTSRLSNFAFSALLHIWRFCKFACRTITGKGNIERLCGSLLRGHALSVSDEGVEAVALDGGRANQTYTRRTSGGIPRSSQQGFVDRTQPPGWKRFVSGVAHGCPNKQGKFRARPCQKGRLFLPVLHSASYTLLSLP